MSRCLRRMKRGHKAHEEVQILRISQKLLCKQYFHMKAYKWREDLREIIEKNIICTTQSWEQDPVSDSGIA